MYMMCAYGRCRNIFCQSEFIDILIYRYFDRQEFLFHLARDKKLLSRIFCVRELFRESSRNLGILRNFRNRREISLGMVGYIPVSTLNRWGCAPPGSGVRAEFESRLGAR